MHQNHLLHVLLPVWSFDVQLSDSAHVERKESPPKICSARPLWSGIRVGFDILHDSHFTPPLRSLWRKGWKDSKDYVYTVHTYIFFSTFVPLGLTWALDSLSTLCSAGGGVLNVQEEGLIAHADNGQSYKLHLCSFQQEVKAGTRRHHRPFSSPTYHEQFSSLLIHKHLVVQSNSDAGTVSCANDCLCTG